MNLFVRIRHENTNDTDMSSTTIDDETLTITMNDFKNATKYIQPSSMREGFATVPDVQWSDVGALSNVRHELMWSILVRFL